MGHGEGCAALEGVGGWQGRGFRESEPRRERAASAADDHAAKEPAMQERPAHDAAIAAGGTPAGCARVIDAGQ